MTRRRVLLVNPNTMMPPIGPLGLEYVAAGLLRHGYEPMLCDLTFAGDPEAAITEALDANAPAAVGVSIRNLDDAYFASQDFVLERTAAVVRRITAQTRAPVILGGIGFSCAPCEVMGFTGAAYGLCGDGEEALPALLDCLEHGGALEEVPGAVFRVDGDRVKAGAPARCPTALMGSVARSFADNTRYFSEGGQAGVETKRGCGQPCVYCADPVAKGSVIRTRAPEHIVAELRSLLDQGIDAIHLCDSEFNNDAAHADAVCAAIEAAGLSQRLRWYTYAAPWPFSAGLARAMARAGCVGINFGVDHVVPEMLRALGRRFTLEDIRNAVAACRAAGIAVMLDLLLGGPGETPDTLEQAIETVRALGPDRAGLSCGVRIYPHTRLARSVQAQGALASNPNLHGTVHDNPDLLRPVFYVDRHIGPGIHRIVSALTGGDLLFMHADPGTIDGNYNYNNNSVLSQAIRNGRRGAYWDILRQLA